MPSQFYSTDFLKFRILTVQTGQKLRIRRVLITWSSISERKSDHVSGQNIIPWCTWSGFSVRFLSDWCFLKSMKSSKFGSSRTNWSAVTLTQRSFGQLRVVLKCYLLSRCQFSLAGDVCTWMNYCFYFFQLSRTKTVISRNVCLTDTKIILNRIDFFQSYFKSDPNFKSILCLWRLNGYIDVGDGCWRRNEDQFKDGKNSLNFAPGWISCLQHNISFTNIAFWHIMMLVTEWNVINMNKNVTNIPFCHQHLKMITIIKSPT